MSDLLRDRTAIVGIGSTEFSKDSGRTELQLSCEAVVAALADAGLSGADVDGMTTSEMEQTPEGEVVRAIGSPGLTFFSRVGYAGGGTAGTLLQAAMAIVSGVAEVVVVYRGMNERSGRRYGDPGMYGGGAAVEQNAYDALFNLHTIHGIQTPAAFMAMAMRRYMHQSGATIDDFGAVAVGARRHAAVNPDAWFHGKPITIDDYRASRPIADPLRLLDCCQETDGGVALVVTGIDRARDLRQRPVAIRAAAHGLPTGTNPMTSFYREDIVPREESELAARHLYRRAGLGPEDVGAAMIYDHFGPSVLPALEAYGFCAHGEAKDFIKDGAIEVGGRLPVNTHGGQVGEGYLHGLNGFTEAVRQIRGTSTSQVAGIENVLATAGNATPTTAVIVGSV